tara:strand:- start:1965 stop:3377 length:1413 start_codon:yes stop_codon:yes gene_type:complete
MTLNLKDVSAMQERNRNGSLQLIESIGRASTAAFALNLQQKAAAYKAITETNQMRLAATEVEVKFRESIRQFDEANATRKAQLNESNQFRSSSEDRQLAKGAITVAKQRLDRLDEEEKDALAGADTVEREDEIRALFGKLREKPKADLDAAYGAAAQIYDGIDWGVDGGGSGDPNGGPSSALLGSDTDQPSEGDYLAPAIDYIEKVGPDADRADVIVELGKQGFQPDAIKEAFDAVDLRRSGDLTNGKPDQPSAAAAPKEAPAPRIENNFNNLARASNDAQIRHEREQINNHPRVQAARAMMQQVTGGTAAISKLLRNVDSMAALQDVEEEIADRIKAEALKAETDISGESKTPSAAVLADYFEAVERLKEADADADTEKLITAKAVVKAFGIKYPDYLPKTPSISDFNDFGASGNNYSALRQSLTEAREAAGVAPPPVVAAPTPNISDFDNFGGAPKPKASKLISDWIK